MGKLQELKREAEQACYFRRHTMMEPWEDHDTRDGGREGAHAVCLDCGMTVSVLTKPSPNEIDVGGKAVALTCEPRVVVDFARVYGDWVQQGPPCSMREFLRVNAELYEMDRRKLLYSDPGDTVEIDLGAGGQHRIIVLTRRGLEMK